MLFYEHESRPVYLSRCLKNITVCNQEFDMESVRKLVAKSALLLTMLAPAAWAATPQCTYGESDGVYSVYWTDTDVYKYIVERAVNNSSWYWRGAQLDNGKANYLLQDNGPKAPSGSTIRYRLRTKAVNNSSKLEDPVLCSLQDNERPSEATLINVVALSSNSLNISWRAATDNVEVDRYLIYRTRTNGGVASKVGESSTLSFTDVGLNPSTKYWYYIKAVDSSGNVGWRTGYHSNTTLDTPKPPTSSERYTTAKVGGRWEIIDTRTSNVTRWNAANVRSDKFSSRPLGAEDIQALSMVFDSMRLVIHWDQLHTGPGQFNQQLQQQLKNVLDHAERYNVDVILDVVHLGGDDTFWMPRWVWQQNGLTPSRSASFALLKSDAIHQYLNWIMDESGIGSHPAVVAVEVVNEPHPAGSSGAWSYEKQRDLMEVYKPMVTTIRQHRPDIIVVLGSYYGGHLFDNGLDDGNAIEDVFANTPNLVWTAHNYFTGIEPQRRGPDYDGDGIPDLDGQDYRGSRGAGVWTESYDSFGCYAQNPPYVLSQCNTSLPLRSTALQGHANNAANHDRVAQQAGMPFFMGEFGMGRLRVLNNRNIGWSGTQAYLCDKLKAYSDLKLNGSNIGISWAVWAFDSQVDGGFGLYNSSTNQWVPDTSNAFFGQCP